MTPIAPLEAARVAAMQAELSAEELAQKLNTLSHRLARGEALDMATAELIGEVMGDLHRTTQAVGTCFGQVAIISMTAQATKSEAKKGPTPCHT